MDRDPQQPIRATYDHGVFTPESDPHLASGTPVTVTPASAEPTRDSIRRELDLHRRVRREGLVTLSGPKWEREELNCLC